VRGKHGLLFALAGAAVDHPDETVRTALYPVVSEATLCQLVKEATVQQIADLLSVPRTTIHGHLDPESKGKRPAARGARNRPAGVATS